MMDRNDGSQGNVEVGTDPADHSTLDHNSPRKRKRTRVTKACETCRKRKERCDGVSPSCGSCVSLGRSCSYASQSRRRGLPPGFVHSREVLLGLLLQVYDGAEDLILQALRGNQPEIQHSAQQRCPQRACDSLLSTWRESKAAIELDKVLDATESKEDDSSSEAQTFDAKLTSLLNACTIQSLADSTTAASDHGMVTPAATSSLVNEPDDIMYDTLPDLPSDRVQGFPPLGVSRPVASLAPAKGFVPPLPESWPRLVELYMANTHCWLPVLEPHSLLRSSSLISQNISGIDKDSLTDGQRASFWSVLSYALHQGSHGPHSFDTEHSQLGQVHIYSRQLALKEYSKYDLGHIHAFLLVGLSHMGQGNWTGAWLWIGRAVYIAVDLGIQIPPKHPSPEIRSDDPRKRAFVSCFFFDTLVASRLGRRPHLQSCDLDQFEDFRTESLEEWDSWRPFGHNTHGTLARTAQGPARILSVWNKLLYLTRLLNRKLWTSGDHVGGGRNQAQFLFDQLVAWQAGIPSAMRIIDGTGFAPIMDAPHTINLTLATASLYLMLLSEIVNDPTTNLNHASIKCRFPEQGWTQIVEFLRQLSSLDYNFSAGWMPPIFEIYITSLDESRKVLCPDLAGWEEAKNSILSIVQNVWAHSHLDVSSSTEAAALLPPSTQLSRAIPTDKSFTFDEFQQVGQFAAPGIAMGNALYSRDQQDSTPRPITHVASAFTQDTSFDSANSQNNGASFQPLGSVDMTGISPSMSADNDLLFNTLSSLDSIEWSGYDEEFIENLGFHGDSTLLNLPF